MLAKIRPSHPRTVRTSRRSDAWIVAVTRRNTSANSVLQHYREGHKDDHICRSIITGENHEALDDGDRPYGRGTYDSDLGASSGRT